MRQDLKCHSTARALNRGSLRMALSPERSLCIEQHLEPIEPSQKPCKWGHEHLFYRRGNQGTARLGTFLKVTLFSGVFLGFKPGLWSPEPGLSPQCSCFLPLLWGGATAERDRDMGFTRVQVPPSP